MKEENSTQEATLPIIQDTQIEEVCRQGQGHKCCKYLTFSARGGGWKCAKGSELQKIIDEISSNMIAKGDNCSGFPDFIKN